MSEPEAPRTALITISTSKAAEPGADTGGPRLTDLAQRLGAKIVGREVITDDRSLIEARLCHWSDVERCTLILTSGGTGLSPTDVTPEATRAILHREAPGIGQAMREASREHTPYWMLSRATAGTRHGCLIVNFPGNPASIDQIGAALFAPLQHALTLINGGHPH